MMRQTTRGASTIIGVCLLLVLALTGCAARGAGIVATPNPTATATPLPAPLAGQHMAAYLTGIAMVSATDGWITGYNDYYTGHALLLHYQHGAWARVPFPLTSASPQRRFYPTGIVMRSATDGWITGYSGTTDTEADTPFLLRYTGGAWREVPLPPGLNSIYALTMVSDTSGWALGAANASASVETHILRYQNGKWTTDTVVPGALTSLSMDSATDGWAAGGSLGAALLRYTGGAWVRITPFSTQQVSAITSIAMETPDSGWATGLYQRAENCSECGGTPGQIVTLRYADGRWQEMSAPSAVPIEIRYTAGVALPPFAVRSLVAKGSDAWLAYGPLVHYSGDGRATGLAAVCQTDLISLSFIPGTVEAWVIGTNGQIYHYGVGTLTRYDSGVECPAA